MRKLRIKMPLKYDKTIHLTVILLIVFGTLMIASTSVGETYSPKTVFVTVIKQSVFVIGSYLAMVFFANVFDIDKISKWLRPIGFAIIVMLISCFFFDEVGGARSWIRISIPIAGQITLQPSEFMKVFMIVAMAVVIHKVKRRNFDCWSIIKIPFSFYIMAGILILVQNDLGSFIVLSLICAICLLIPSHPNLAKLQKYVMILLAVGSTFVIFLASDVGLAIVEKMSVIPDHVVTRFVTAANPWVDEFDKGNQLINSLLAFASGGWRGLGFGHSIQKMSRLSASSTDYILAIVVEELGVLGFLMVLLGYSILIYRLFKYALLSKKEGYKVLYIGTAMYLFLHFTFNVGGVIGLIPLTGVPLLFISAGASSLMSVCVAFGVCQAAIAKENRERARI